MELDFFQLRHACHKVGNLVAEFATKVLVGDVGILDGIVQQCGTNSVDVQTHIDKDVGNDSRVGDVGATACTELPLVCLLRHLERRIYFVYVFGMVVMLYLAQKVLYCYLSRFFFRIHTFAPVSNFYIRMQKFVT